MKKALSIAALQFPHIALLKNIKRITFLASIYVERQNMLCEDRELGFT